MVKAIHAGVDIIEPQKPNTIAKSIAIGNPADGYYVYQAVKESGGWGESATDREIVDAIKLLAKTEGIWTEPAGGTTLAAAIKLIQQGRIPRDESIVISITGNGLKTLEAVQNELPQPVVIEAKIDGIRRTIGSEQAWRAGNPWRYIEISFSRAPCSPCLRVTGIARSRSARATPEKTIMSIKVRIPSPLRSYTNGVDIMKSTAPASAKSSTI